MTPPLDDRQILSQVLADADRDAATSPTPDDETLCAYLSGSLSEDESERVRARVAARPELAARLIELEPFVAASPASDTVADFEARSAWRDFERRLAGGTVSAPLPAAAGRRSNRLLTALAAVFVLVTCGLSLWIWQLEQATRRPLGNLRTLELLADARSGNTTQRFAIVAGERFRIALYPAELPAGCNVYRVEIRDPNAATVAAIDNLRPDARGRLDLLLAGEPGARVLELSACGEERGRFSFDLVSE